MKSRYLLDTNILSDLLRKPQGDVAQRIAREGENSIRTSIVVAAELRFGAQKRSDDSTQGGSRTVMARIHANVARLWQ